MCSPNEPKWEDIRRMEKQKQQLAREAGQLQYNVPDVAYRALSAGERVDEIQKALHEADQVLGELAIQIDHVLRPDAGEGKAPSLIPERPTQSSLAHWLDDVREHVQRHVEMINELRRRVDN